MRVAVAKSVGRLIPLLSLDPLTSIFSHSEANFRGYLEIINCLILLLNDEQPDIRSYILNQGLTKIIKHNIDYKLQGPNLTTEGDTTASIVELND